MIDWARVSMLRDEVGAEDFNEVVELFLEEVEEIIIKLRDAPDVSTLEADLHFLKGSALSLGFRAFSALCNIGESISAAGASETVDISRVLDCYQVSKQAFLSELPGALTR